MFKYGLKLWSTNLNYLNAAVQLYARGVYDFIELFVVPGTKLEFCSAWEVLRIPYIIHAPHYDKGVNLSRHDQLVTNMDHVRETIAFADALAADTIIFHPGIEGDICETVKQLKQIADSRIVIENKPHFGRNNEICIGSTPDEIRFIMDNTKVGFCMDIGHAICAANAKQIPPMDMLQDLLVLSPRIFHLTDGLRDSLYDRHDHFGKGDYDIPTLLGLLPANAIITVETDKDDCTRLNDFERDIMFLKSLNKDSNHVTV